MDITPPLFIAVLLVLLSVAGIGAVVMCVDFLRPPGQRARVDHHRPPPAKGLASAPPMPLARPPSKPPTLAFRHGGSP